MNTVIGIDPGFSGGIAVLLFNGSVGIHSMPVIRVGKPYKARKKVDAGPTPSKPKKRRPAQKTVLDLTVLKDLFSIAEYTSRMVGVHVFIEKVTPMPKQGITSTAHYFLGYGQIIGILVGLGIPYTEVTPQAWKKEMMAGMGREKTESIIRARQLFPTAGPGKLNDGQAEALLLAEFGRRRTP